MVDIILSNVFEIGIFIGIVIAIDELIKTKIGIQGKILPIINLVAGVVFGIFYFTSDIKTNIIIGIIIGLCSNGVYDVSKITKK